MHSSTYPQEAETLRTSRKKKNSCVVVVVLVVVEEEVEVVEEEFEVEVKVVEAISNGHCKRMRGLNVYEFCMYSLLCSGCLMYGEMKGRML